MSKSEKIIKKASSNQELQKVYANRMRRYTIAIQKEFYFEALWILYAMLEARTSAFFYHLGFVRTDDRRKVIKTKKELIKNILQIPENRNLSGFDKLKPKLKYMKTLLAWSLTDSEENDLFVKAVKAEVRNIYSEDLVKAIENLHDTFCFKRNQLTHALLYKNLDAVSAEFAELTKAGEYEMRIIDNAVDKLKRHSKIRKRFNIQQ